MTPAGSPPNGGGSNYASKIAVVTAIILALVALEEAAGKLIAGFFPLLDQIRTAFNRPPPPSQLSKESGQGVERTPDKEPELGRLERVPLQNAWFAAVSSYDAPNHTDPELDAKNAVRKLAATMRDNLEAAIYQVGSKYVVTVSGPVSKLDADRIAELARLRGVSSTAWASDRVRGGKKVASCTERGCTW